MRILFLLFLSLACLKGISQITVDATVNETQAMQTLLGENVTISNLQFTGFNDQIGTFTCVDCGLDFEEGVILATGSVETALGPNQSGSNTIGGSFGSGSDIDLDILNPNSAGDFNDIAVLEFDFVSLGDSVWFDYVFASDEYPEFSGSAFNDTFGFFMSGPGISGPYSNNSENLALIPGTDIGVTINNVNAGTAGTAQEGDAECNNCEFYENNGTGQMGQPQYDDPNVMGYDGFTVGLRAIRGGLICGETYHLRIVIADAGDNSFDSAVFLKAGSLSSNLTVQVELVIEATNEDGVMNEECGLSTLTFSRPEAIDSSLPFTVNIAYSGDAINGVDYTLLPEMIVFDPGVDEISFTLDAFEDSEIEGLESVLLDMQSVAVCEGESVPSSFEFFITESVPLEVQGYEVEICQGSSTDISPILINGSGGFEYLWSTGETTSEINVSPSESTSYSVSISDTCLVTSDDAEILVNVAEFPELEVMSTPDELDISCNWFGQFMTSAASGGDGSYSYSWTNQDGQVLSGNSDFFLFQVQQELFVTVTDGCGVESTTEIPINTDVLPLTVEVPEEINVCEGEHTIEAIIEGNDPINISWFDQFFNTLGTDSELTLEPTDDMIITLFVNDNCGQSYNQDIAIAIVDPQPLVLEPFVDFDAGCTEEVTVPSPIISGSPDYDFEWSTASGLDLGQEDFATLIIEETEIVYMSVEDACGETAEDSVQITLVQTPLELDVPDNLVGDCLSLFEIEIGVNIDEDVPLVWTGPADLVQVDNYSANYQSFDSGTVTIEGDAGCGNLDTESFDISISSPPLIIQASENQLICADESVILQASASGGSGQYVFQWLGEDVLDSQLEVSPSNNSSYTVQVNDECLNSTSTQSFVEVEHLGVAFSYVQLDFNSFEFNPIVSEECENCTYFWEFSDGGISNDENPTHVFNQIEEFSATLSVVSDNGCLSEYTEIIVVPIIYVPNSFTPNNDGLNDAFKVEAVGLNSYKIQVYNRWGEIVFESHDPEQVWDGSFKGGDYYCQPGIFNFIISYKSLDTSAQEMKGTISLIR